MVRWSVLLSVLALAACEPKPKPRSLTEQRPRGDGVEEGALKAPVYLWEQSLGPCGAEVAMDGDGTSWLEGGCESGPKLFAKHGSFTVEQQSAVRKAFEALPPPNEKKCEWSDRFRSRATDGTARVWEVCGREGNHPNPLEIEGLPAPFDQVARALKQ
jgi:hypothetical protein